MPTDFHGFIAGADNGQPIYAAPAKSGCGKTYFREALPLHFAMDLPMLRTLRRSLSREGGIVRQSNIEHIGTGEDSARFSYVEAGDRNGAPPCIGPPETFWEARQTVSCASLYRCE